jgi:dolichyl-phosphate beta-glucosyltransferase
MKQTSNILLSIIIPAHNEEHRLPGSLKKIDDFLRKQTYQAEVIIVENGSSDRTTAVVEAFMVNHPYVRLIQADSRGKGLAVRMGMLAACGEYRFVCDADLSMPIDEIVKFLPPYTAGYDIIIATREGKDAHRIGEPTYRHIMGRINNVIIKLIVLPDFQDTQCGFKMFSGRVAEDLFGVQQLAGIGFDIEILYVAKKRGYKVREVPITWFFDPDSRIRLIHDSLHILSEIFQIRHNWRNGVYEQAEQRQHNPIMVKQ